MSWKDIINVGSEIKDIVVDDEKKEDTREKVLDEMEALYLKVCGLVKANELVHDVADYMKIALEGYRDVPDWDNA